MNENEIQADSNEQQPAGEELTNDLADLPVAAEQETSVVAGGGHVKVFDGRNGLSINHNETTAEDKEDETDALADLPAENDEQVKGGPGGILYGTGGLGGAGIFNHNETTAADDEAETEALDDLPAANADEVTGGMLKRIRIGGMNAQ